MKTWNIAVIGAGAAGQVIQLLGLCAARHIASRGNMKPVIFEKAHTVGGVWCYTDKTDKDEYGLKIHSAMYKNLRTNLPKEVMEFPDFPFRSEYPSFMTHELLSEYLSSYSKHFELDKYIKFGCLVRNVKPNTLEDTSSWEVTVEDLRKKSTYTTTFDAVFVCNGHYATPLHPNFVNQGYFKGNVIHSHSYRTPEQYSGKKVLIVGCKSSGQDISLDIAKHAESVIISHRTSLVTCPLPENVNQRPPIATFKEDGRTICFADGSEAEFDDIVNCTGYLYDFPFLDEDCDIKVDDGRICHLYKHIINPSHPSLMFIGVCGVICPFPQFHFQVLYSLAALDGSLKLPSKAAMMNDIENDYQERLRNGIPHRKSHVMGAAQWAYNDMLADAISEPRLHPRVEKLYNDVHDTRTANLRRYREHEARLLDTGMYELRRSPGD